MNSRLPALLLLGWGSSLGASATVRLPALVGDHMVLQRDAPARREVGGGDERAPEARETAHSVTPCFQIAISR